MEIELLVLVFTEAEVETKMETIVARDVANAVDKHVAKYVGVA